MGGWRPGELAGLALLAGGVLLVGMSFAGYLIGHQVDLRLGTEPRWAIVGLIFGAVLGFWDLYRIAQWAMRQQPPPARPWETVDDDKADRTEGDRDENHE